MVPAPAELIMARSAAPPPFQLIDSSPVLEEEFEGGELLSEKTEASSTHADGDAGQDKPSAGGDGIEGGGGGDILSGGGGGEELPENMRANMEVLSGHNLGGIRVNYNSEKPQVLGAKAFARGMQIELAAGQEKLLGAAVWAIVQQQKGLAVSTKTIKGNPVSDDSSLESESMAMAKKVAMLSRKLYRALSQKVDTSAEADSTPRIVVIPGSFRVIDEEEGNDDRVTIEPLAPEVETGPLDIGDEIAPFIPEIPENAVVNVPEIDLTQGFDNMKAITEGSILDTLGISIDFLRSIVFDLTLKFSFYLGIEVEVLKGLFGVEGGFIFEAAASVNQQDDRLVRAGWTVSYGGQLTTTILWFIENKNTWLQSFGKLSVYQDLAHFSAHQFGQLSVMVDEVAEETDEVQSLPQSTYDGDGRSMAALRGSSPTDVHHNSSSSEWEIGLNAPGGDDGASISASSSSKEMNFYRGEGADRQVRRANQEDKSYSVNLNIGNTEATFTFTDSVIGNHANEDNDGHYHNWSVTLKKTPLNPKDFAKKFGNAMNNIAEGIRGISAAIRAGQTFGAGAWGTVKALLLGEDFSDVSASSEGPTSGQIDHYYTGELNFVESNGEMTLQYLRVSQGTTATAKFEASIPVFSNGVVGVNVNISASASIDFSSTIFEVTGGETISYFLTVYNGLVYTDDQVASGFAPSKEGGWPAFRHQHRPGINRLIQNLADPESVAYKEAMAYEAAHPESIAFLLLAAQRKVDGEIGLDAAIGALEAFFAANYEGKAERGSEVSQDITDFDTDGRTPWAKVLGGKSTFTVDMNKTGYLTVNQDSNNPENTAVNIRPNSIVESLLQDQEVECRVKVPYRERKRVGWDTSNSSGPKGAGRTPIYRSDHNHEASVTIPRLTNRSEAMRIMSRKYWDAWKDSPSRIPYDIRNLSFTNPELDRVRGEYNSAKSLSTSGSRTERPGARSRMSRKAKEFVTVADTPMQNLMEKIVLDQTSNS